MSLLSDSNTTVLQCNVLTGNHVQVNNLTAENMEINAVLVDQLFVADLHLTGEMKFDDSNVNITCNNATSPNNILLGDIPQPTGLQNISLGHQNTTFLGNGNANIVIGDGARTDPVDNKATNHGIAIGYQAALEHTMGNDASICIGSGAGVPDMGANNVILGRDALADDSAGGNVVAIGYHAIKTVSGGTNNVVIGNNAGNQTAMGDKNVLLGVNTSTNGNLSYAIAIGTNVTVPAPNTIAIGSQVAAAPAQQYAHIVLGHAAGGGAANSMIPFFSTDEDAFAGGVPYGGLYCSTVAGKTTLCICLWP